MRDLLKVVCDSSGATAIEYALIASLIAVASVTAMQGVGDKLDNIFNNTGNKLV